MRKPMTEEEKQRRIAKTRTPVTAAQRAEIRRLALDGVSHWRITQIVKVGYSSVLKYADFDPSDARNSRIKYGEYTVAPAYQDMPIKRYKAPEIG